MRKQRHGKRAVKLAVYGWTECVTALLLRVSEYRTRIGACVPLCGRVDRQACGDDGQED